MTVDRAEFSVSTSDEDRGTVIEARGDLQIARDDGHAVSRDEVEEVVFPAARDGRVLALAVPLVRFAKL